MICSTINANNHVRAHQEEHHFSCLLQRPAMAAGDGNSRELDTCRNARLFFPLLSMVDRLMPVISAILVWVNFSL
jgi:hypothetical protein